MRSKYCAGAERREKAGRESGSGAEKLSVRKLLRLASDPFFAVGAHWKRGDKWRCFEVCRLAAAQPPSSGTPMIIVQ